MLHDQEQLVVEWVPRARVFLNPGNPRINDPAVPHVAASLQRFGWRQPLVVKRSGEVVAGNTRLKAAEQLGMESVPVAWFDGDELEAKAYAVADNRTAEFATWDLASLAELELGNSQELEDPGPEEPPEAPVSRPGDLWVLGAHRLLCGDSRSQADLQRLLDGELAALMSTDPPMPIITDLEDGGEALEAAMLPLSTGWRLIVWGQGSESPHHAWKLSYWMQRVEGLRPYALRVDNFGDPSDADPDSDETPTVKVVATWTDPPAMDDSAIARDLLGHYVKVSGRFLDVIGDDGEFDLRW